MSLKRLKEDPDSLDMFVTSNIQATSDTFPYALDFYEHKDELDLSNTYEGLIKNAILIGTTATNNEQLYTIPFGGEVRGMFVNKTLLDKYNLKVPTNRQELLDDCKVLSENGYVPLQGNPGDFSQLLMYPYICNMIANADDYNKIYTTINNCEDGVEKLFEEPLSFLYELTAKRYYNYNYVENTLHSFTDMDMKSVAKDFLNIKMDEQSNEYKKVDDIGNIAFMPAPMSYCHMVDKYIEDYHSNIEYEFIMSPVSDEGSYAYLSPSQGISVNKNSKNIEWSLRFLNYLFSEDANKEFAKEDNIIPNTKDALDYLSDMYDLPEDHISQLGQVTFDFEFYPVMFNSMLEISKSNNPKYMKDENTMYDFSYYMDNLKKAFEEQRNNK